MSTPRPKYFGIGFPKTGSNSLAQALEMLGLRVCHFGAYEYANPEQRHILVEISRAYKAKDADPLAGVAEFVGQYDCLLDFPVPTIWPALYAADPEAKFISFWRNPHEIAMSAARQNWRAAQRGVPAPWAGDSYEALVRQIEAHYSAIFTAAHADPQRFLLLSITDSADHLWRSLSKLTGLSIEKILMAGILPPWPKGHDHEYQQKLIDEQPHKTFTAGSE